MVSGKMSFKVFSIISLWKLLIPGAGFVPQDLDWQNLCRGPLDIYTYQI